MNARILKESRMLLPAFGLSLLAAILPAIIWPEAEVGVVLFAACCALMAASSFGTEFHGRTISLLLVQPVARRIVWSEKMLVLGSAIALGFVTLLICSHVPGPLLPWVLALTVIPGCVFCATPWLTLTTRNTLLGTVLSIGLPMTICAVLSGFVWLFSLEGSIERNPYPYVTIPAVIYCALSYRFGYGEFMRLQVIDSQAQEISLPLRLEAALARPFSKVVPGFTGPFASLVKKELRLQQISFLGAALFCVVAIAAGLLYQCHILLGDGTNLASLFLGMDFVYVPVVPFIAGAISVAEEKGWGVADWQLTLPPSALKQWSVKMLVTLSTSLVLGLLLPAALFLAGKEFLGIHPGEALPQDIHIMAAVVMGHLLLTSVVIYAASLARTTIGAILLSLGMVLLAGSAMQVATRLAVEGFRLPSFAFWEAPREAAETWLWSAGTGMFAMLCLIQRFAFVCYRRRGLTIRQRTIQVFMLVGVLFAVCFGTVAWVGRW